MQTLPQELLDYINSGCCGNTTPTPKPPTINYTATTLTFTQGTAVNICPATLTGDPTIVVTVNPSLPAGLSLDPATGCITGTPTSTSTTTQYTFTATNSVGTDTDAIDITVNAVPPTVVSTCYSKTTQSDVFTAQSGFPAKIALTGTGTLQETVYGLTYVTGNEADGQYSLRNGANDLAGSTSSYAYITGANAAVGSTASKVGITVEVVGSTSVPKTSGSAPDIKSYAASIGASATKDAYAAVGYKYYDAGTTANIMAYKSGYAS